MFLKYWASLTGKQWTVSELCSFEGLIVALFDASADKDPNVRETVLESLNTVGKLQHGMLLNSVHAYLARQSKVSSHSNKKCLKSDYVP